MIRYSILLNIWNRKLVFILERRRCTVKSCTYEGYSRSCTSKIEYRMIPSNGTHHMTDEKQAMKATISLLWLYDLLTINTAWLKAVQYVHKSTVVYRTYTKRAAQLRKLQNDPEHWYCNYWGWHERRQKHVENCGSTAPSCGAGSSKSQTYSCLIENWRLEEQMG